MLSWQFKYNLNRHRQRLKSIKNTKVNQTFDIKYSKARLFNDHRISRENQRMLDRLIQITNKKPKKLYSLNYPRTLNSQLRKQEAYRISLENKKIANYLSNLHSKTLGKRSPYLEVKGVKRQNTQKDKLSALNYSTKIKLKSITPVPNEGMEFEPYLNE